ncbi:hypothetical protein ACIBCM_06415 [Streptomyces sp. NPDC051018]|uniref:hypothetical protein n=1 Tax=Streptomyces sp. NPDC051018 TaxID=3365639 RepID=UPI0037998271
MNRSAIVLLATGLIIITATLTGGAAGKPARLRAGAAFGATLTLAAVTTLPK